MPQNDHAKTKVLKMRAFILIFLLYGPIPSHAKAESPGQQGGTTDQENSAISNPAPTPENSDGNQPAAKNQNQRAGDNSTPDWWVVRLTFALVLVGGAQVWVYVEQAKLMREALEQSKRSTERAQRAYLVINYKADSGFREDNKFYLVLKNTGQTPAHSISVRFNWKLYDGESVPFSRDEKFKDLPVSRDGIVDLGPGEEIPVAFRFDKNETTPIDDYLAKCLRKEITIYYYGVFSYRDAFGKKRKTVFCFEQSNDDRGEIAPASRHNKTY